MAGLSCWRDSHTALGPGQTASLKKKKGAILLLLPPREAGGFPGEAMTQSSTGVVLIMSNVRSFWSGDQSRQSRLLSG